MPLAVDHVAGIVNGDCGRERSESLAKRLVETVIGQEFLHIQHRGTELLRALEQLAIGLHRVAAAGGRHQHGIEFSLDVVHAAHEVRCQLASDLQFALVMADRTTAALVGWDHHLKAIGLQHLHGGGADGGIETALHATQQQGNPAAA